MRLLVETDRTRLGRTPRLVDPHGACVARRRRARRLNRVGFLFSPIFGAFLESIFATPVLHDGRLLARLGRMRLLVETDRAWLSRTPRLVDLHGACVARRRRRVAAHGCMGGRVEAAPPRVLHGVMRRMSVRCERLYSLSPAGTGSLLTSFVAVHFAGPLWSFLSGPVVVLRRGFRCCCAEAAPMVFCSGSMDLFGRLYLSRWWFSGDRRRGFRCCRGRDRVSGTSMWWFSMPMAFYSGSVELHAHGGGAAAMQALLWVLWPREVGSTWPSGLAAPFPWLSEPCFWCSSFSAGFSPVDRS